MRLTGPAAVVALLCAAPDFATAERMDLSDQPACDQILFARSALQKSGNLNYYLVTCSMTRGIVDQF